MIKKFGMKNSVLQKRVHMSLLSEDHRIKIMNRTSKVGNLPIDAYVAHAHTNPVFNVTVPYIWEK